MAGIPVTPVQYKTFVPQVNSSLCQKMVGVLLAKTAADLQNLAFLWNDDGTPSDAQRAALGLATGSLLAAPSGFTATGAATTIVLEWAEVAEALSYNIFRSTTPNPPVFIPTNALVTGTTGGTFTDSAAVASTPAFQVGQIYWYWIQATNASATSATTGPVSAFAGTNLASPQSFGPGGGVSQQFVVPGGVTSIDIECWGSGADGGDGSPVFAFGQPGVITTYYGGGGGGSGAYRKSVDVAVSPGDILTVVVAEATAGNGSLSQVVDDVGLVLCMAGGGITGSQGSPSNFFNVPGGGAGGSNGSTTGVGIPVIANGVAGSSGSLTGGGAGGPAVVQSADSAGAGGQGAPANATDPVNPGSLGGSGKVKISW